MTNQTLKLGDKVYSYTERDGVIEYNITGIRLYNDATFYEIEHGDVKLLIIDRGFVSRIFEYTDVLKDEKYTGFSSKYPKVYYENKETAVHDYLASINSNKWKKISQLEEAAHRLLLEAGKLKKEMYEVNSDV